MREKTPEAYFSPDGKKLIFQRTVKSDGCDQIFSMNLDGSEMKQLSTGGGKTTCAYFTPDKKHIVYATTAKAASDCPPKPDYSRGYVWSLFPGFDICPGQSGRLKPTAADDHCPL